jgi:hypothetical protein
MRTEKQLISLAHKEFGFPNDPAITEQYDDAARFVLEKTSEKTFRTLDIVNAATGEKERIDLNAAQLLLDRKLPLTESISLRGRELQRSIMARLSIMLMQSAERLGLDAADTAIAVPFDNEGYRSYPQHRGLGSYWDDTYFEDDEKKERTIHAIQKHINHRYARASMMIPDQPSIYGHGEADTTFELVPLLPQRDAEKRIIQLLGAEGLTMKRERILTGMEEESPGYRAIDLDGRSRSLQTNDTYRLAANDSLAMIEHEGADRLF